MTERLMWFDISNTPLLRQHVVDGVEVSCSIFHTLQM